MDTNGMLQGLYRPVANVGVIPGKVIPDQHVIDEHTANADDPAVAKFCYPGGGKAINHDIKLGYPLFSYKCVRNPDVPEGEPNEFAIASVAGLNTDLFNSHRSMEGNFYFVGFATGDQHQSDPNGDSTTSDPQGVGTIRVGTVSTYNNGPYMFYPVSFLLLFMCAENASRIESAITLSCHSTFSFASIVVVGVGPYKVFNENTVIFMTKMTSDISFFGWVISTVQKYAMRCLKRHSWTRLVQDTIVVIVQTFLCFTFSVVSLLFCFFCCYHNCWTTTSTIFSFFQSRSSPYSVFYFFLHSSDNFGAFARICHS